MAIAIRPVPPESAAEFLAPLSTAFGLAVIPERVDRVRSIPELHVRLGAYDGDAIVGSAGSYTFDLTVPGGVAVETAGLTMVAVLPTHRRRGVLRELMRSHLDQARDRGQAVAALFASEGAIYGRFGYGMASLGGAIDLPRHRAAFARPLAPEGSVRLVGEAEALATFPSIWERVRLERPGMLSRSEGWWRVRRTPDPEWLRAGRPPLQRALLAIDGRPAAYALYRFSEPFGHVDRDVALDVVEAIGDTPAATRSIWRYLLDVDLVSRIRAHHLPIDHPLLFLLAEPRALHLEVGDSLWVRLVDVGAALSRRGYAVVPEGEPLVIEVGDAFCPWNEGRYRLARGVAERTSVGPDLTLDADALGAAYLGGAGFTALAQAGRVIEHRSGALRRADALFRGDRAPWCPEVF